MVVTIPANDLERISYLRSYIGAPAAVRYMDRVLENMASAGNASVIPFRTKTRRTVTEWPTPPRSA